MPPKWPLRFFRWFCRPEMVEDIEGDLVERFNSNIQATKTRRAKWRFIWQVVLLVRPGIVRPFVDASIIYDQGILKNYLKVGWRSLMRHKLYGFINVGGLTLGLACFLSILLYVNHERSYDRHFDNADQIYRIYTQEHSGDKYLGSDLYATIPMPLAEAIRDDFPEVIHLTCIEEHSVLVGNERNKFLENGLWVDQSFFEVFSFKFTQGNSSLGQPDGIIITESLASRLFQDNNPIGKSITQQVGEQQKILTVIGVIANPPENTTFRFSFLGPINSSPYFRNAWDTSNTHAFALLDKNTILEQLEAKIPVLLKRYRNENKWTDYHQEEYQFQPLLDYHLENKVNGDIGVKGNPIQVAIFWIVAVLVLILACINYMNLAIARSVNRAKEVGLRKTVGARRRQLIGQFLGESVLLSFVSLIIAIAIVIYFLPSFSLLVERPLELNPWSSSSLLANLLGLVVMVGLVSGSYPAFYLSSIRPIGALNRSATHPKQHNRFQRILIISQYTISIILIISSIVVFSQYRFIQKKELGFDRENIIAIRINDFPSKEKFQVLKSLLLSDPKILQVSASTELPTNITSSTVINYVEGKTDDPLVIYRMGADVDFSSVFGLELINGRISAPKSSGESEGTILLNESALSALGWTNEGAIGQRIKNRGIVSGVVKDFNIFSLHHQIEPLMIQIQDNASFEYISVKINPDDIAGVLTSLEKSVKEYSDFPFEYQFVDQTFDQLYKADIRMGKIIGLFTIISILIASLGVFGLAAFNAIQRSKEISIRKILGASTRSIFKLLTTDFLKVVMISFILSIPISWYMAIQWLSNFAYHIEIEWWMFLISGLIAGAFVFLSVCFQAIKATSSNPIESIRNE